MERGLAGEELGPNQSIAAFPKRDAHHKRRYHSGLLADLSMRGKELRAGGKEPVPAAKGGRVRWGKSLSRQAKGGRVRWGKSLSRQAKGGWVQ